MGLLQCFFVLLVAFVCLTSGWSEAFLTAPLPAYARGLAAYDVTETNERSEMNEVLQRLDEDQTAIMKTSFNGRSTEERDGSIYVLEFESETNGMDDRSMNSTTG